MYFCTHTHMYMHAYITAYTNKHKQGLAVKGDAVLERLSFHRDASHLISGENRPRRTDRIGWVPDRVSAVLLWC